MSPFDLFFDALKLQQAGRSNAAKAQWSQIQPFLQEKFLDLVLRYRSMPDVVLEDTIHFTSPFGTFMLNNERVNLIRNYGPGVIL